MISWTFNHLSGFFPRTSSTRALPTAPKTVVRQESASVLSDNPHLAERRASALRSLFPKLSSWFGSRRDALLIGEINEYLSQASNVTDLEQRIRVIERQRHFS
ncbi:MAG: hypothetical protein ACXW13_02125 [Burkholderiaceae bacterium]